MEHFGPLCDTIRMINMAAPNLSASDETVEQLTGLVIEESEIKKKLLKMREDKAPGVDKLLPRLLCNVVEEICRPLWLIFNKSLRKVQFRTTGEEPMSLPY